MSTSTLSIKKLWGHYQDYGCSSGDNRRIFATPTGVDLEEVMSLRHDKKYMSYMLCFALKL